MKVNNNIEIEREERIANAMVKQCQDQRKSKPEPSVDALAVVYEALLTSFVNQQKVEADDIAIVRSNIELQKKSNEKLDTLNFNIVLSYDEQLSVQHEKFISDFKTAANNPNDVIYRFGINADEMKQIENYIRTGTMPPESNGRLHTIMNGVRVLWNSQDFVGKAKEILTKETNENTPKNSLITSEREGVSNDIVIAQQQAQLASSYCQSTSSRLTQTTSTFTALLAANKSAVEQIYK